MRSYSFCRYCLSYRNDCAGSLKAEPDRVLDLRNEKVRRDDEVEVETGVQSLREDQFTASGHERTGGNELTEVLEPDIVFSTNLLDRWQDVSNRRALSV